MDRKDRIGVGTITNFSINKTGNHLRDYLGKGFKMLHTIICAVRG